MRGADHEPETGVFAGVMYGDYGFRANLRVRGGQPVPLLGGLQPREPAVAAARVPRSEPRGRHGLLVVGHRAAPGLCGAQSGRVPRGRRRRRQPDSRPRSVCIARPSRHPLDAREVRAVRRRRGRHRARRRRRRRRAASARRGAPPRRSHLRRHQGHGSEHRERHGRVHRAEPAGAGRGDSPRACEPRASIREPSPTSRRTGPARRSAIRSRCAD